MATYLLFIVMIIAGTGGELCTSRAMKNVGEVTSFHPIAILRFVLRALREPWMWIGVGMSAAAFFSLLGALSKLNVSFVVPVTALSYVVGALGGVLFLRERVSPQRWMGVILVALGVTLVCLGNH